MILILQTADTTTRIWLTEISSPDAEPQLEWESGRTLSDDLLTRLQKALSTLGASLESLSGIIIFSGPGSFTSLRIGHTVANALAASLNIPIVGAQGDDWRITGREALQMAVLGRIALPFYGAEPHITRPKA
jgi:tRNA threonylcarbamoyladenosine biosynthesis protein TsaB